MNNGWQTKTLGEVCQFRGGGTPSKAVDRYWRGDIPWVSPKDMKFNVVSDSIDHISRDAIAGSATSLIPKDSVLLVVRSGILARTVPIAITGRPLTINQDLKALCPNKEIDARFLYHLLSSKMDVLLSMVSRGATVHRLMTEQVRSLDFTLPPLPEQQRIVGVLDEVFEGIATAKANAEKNLQNARDLFESHRQSVFTKRGHGWEETSLGEAYDVRDGTHDSPKYQATGYPLITSKNLKTEGLSFDDVNLISTQDYNKINERSVVHKNDVLFAMIGTIGNPTLVTIEPNFAIKNVALFKIPKGQSGAFLKYYLGSTHVVSKMMEEAKGTTQKFVGLGYLRKFPINLPPLEVQLEVVKELDELSEEARRLESIYERKLAALDALKKSLLQQAFTGQL